MFKNLCLFFSLAAFLCSASTAQSRETAGSSEVEAVEQILNAFHKAASEADEELYFGFFAPEGVFMGTDGGERWTVPQYRAFAHPYFSAGKGWTFVPRDRFVFLDGRKTVAWFDEKLDSASYGECRGTGVLLKLDGAWKVAHYNLTVPVPNDLLKDLVQRIRGDEPERTVVFIVRHAEKMDDTENPDPVLSEEGEARADRLARMLVNQRLGAAYATEYKRTQQTVAPAAAAVGIAPTVVEAAGVKELAEALKTRHKGQSVLVSGHSNTVPALIAALGVEKEIVVKGGDYGNLFVVTLNGGDKPLFLHLRFGW